MLIITKTTLLSAESAEELDVKIKKETGNSFPTDIQLSTSPSGRGVKFSALLLYKEET